MTIATDPANITSLGSVLSSERCAACGRPLTDELSISLAIGPDCRGQFGYKHISSLNREQWEEANTILHTIAHDVLVGDPLRQAIFRLADLGFIELSKRITQRVGKHTVEVTAEPATPVHAPFGNTVQTEVTRPLGISPTPHQERALDAVRRLVKSGHHGVVFIVGFAGTGKTTITQFIAAEHGRPVVICPTGRAAIRVREAAGLDAMTIHRWMYEPKEDPKTGQIEFVRGDPYVPPSRIVILDEASMVGPDLWSDIYAVAQQYDLRLIVVGDGFQLPPVQKPNEPPYSVLVPSFAQQLKAERVELTEVLRQAAGSPIIRVATGLRQGKGWSAMRDLTVVTSELFWQVALATYQQGGVIICHRNATRFKINLGIRTMLGLAHDDMPVPGEPLMCLRNTYECGVMNGEMITFPGWTPGFVPEHYEGVRDRYTGAEGAARFGGITLGKTNATIAVEELHGKLTPAARAIQIAAGKWARLESFMSGDKFASHINANFGYAYTAHKAQGSQWPYVFVVLESSIRLDEEDGRRWAYMAETRGEVMTAVYPGNP